MKRKRVREGIRNFTGRLRGRKMALIAVLVIAILVIPQPSQGQFIPSPCCAILSAGLGSIASAITNVVGSALNAINSTLTSIEDFQRAIVWPQELIDRARAAVGSIQGIFNDIRGLGQVAVASATLPAPRQLEQTLLSGDPAQLNAVASQYTAVYSAVPLPPDASPQVRDLIDMTDAAAQAAMKRAIAIDAIAEMELEASDRIIQEVQAAAPGSAPIIEAGAAAWLVRANAHTQAALTELMRLRAIDLANVGAEMKLGAQYGAQLRGNVTDALQRR
jgi:hypothetical protein